jgi:pyruvate/2-oxoglutarate/acetoin dehydrogenase E1 component/TPP-dependent pyruvate/acetoin dehydrogenase alpha subunit
MTRRNDLGRTTGMGAQQLNLSQQTALEIYQRMVRIRACDDRIQMSLKAGHLQFQYYPCAGQEAIPATLNALLRADDMVVTTYRVVHDIIAKGSSMREVMAEMYGRISGTSKGKGGPMHLSDPSSGLMVTTGIVGAGLPIANGLALAQQFKGTDKVVVVSFGDGAANIGAFNEAVNLAAVWQLPVIFLCQNNAYAEYTSYADSTKSPSIATRAAGYGLPGVTVDGTDPEAIYAAAKTAIERARTGGGPTLLECMAHRLQGHAFGSAEDHMDQDALAKAKATGPMISFRAALKSHYGVSEDALSKIEAEAQAEVEDALLFAEESQAPGANELYTDIFADMSVIPDSGIAWKTPAEPKAPTGAPRQLMTCQAIADGLDVALTNDPSVFLMGEDIQDPAGGVLKTTYGLSTKHGLTRVRPTPISEQAIVGAGIGAALAGMKPVIEIMVCDFAMVCMDQIANHAAKLRYMSGGRTTVPLTIRTLTAGNVGSFGAQHSQSLEAMFAHVPGLKIVTPSNAYDAKGLLLSCIDDPDPCIFLEAARVHFVPGMVPEGDYRIPLGQAKVLREGSDISIITYSWGVQEALGAAEALAGDGVSAEVVDLRTIIPLDWPSVLASVSKTRRAVIVHPAVEFCGFGAELAARLQDTLFGQLKAPVARVGARYTPIPFSQSLEAHHFPNAEGVIAQARRLMAWN